MRINFSDTVVMMNSRDYRDRFVAEYIQTKIRYERLKAFCNRIEAAKLDPTLTEPKHDCPCELLRKQQSVMGEYLHQLELRAVIEDIDLEDAMQYVEEQATRVRESKQEETPFDQLEGDAAIIREAVARVLRADVLTDEDDERVFCAVLRIMDELDGCKCATVAKDIPSTPDPTCTCCQSENEPPCERGGYEGAQDADDILSFEDTVSTIEHCIAPNVNNEAFSHCKGCIFPESESGGCADDKDIVLRSALNHMKNANTAGA